MRNILDKEAIQARVRITKALQMAISETEKLNKLLDEMHNSAIAYQNQKAA